MSDLLTRANSLERLAKAARDKEGDQAEIEKLKLALDGLSTALTVLEEELKTRRVLDSLDAPRLIQIDLQTAHSELRDFVATRGRPTTQRIQSASRRTNEQSARLREESKSRWEAWSRTALDAVPRHKVSALAPDDRSRVGAVIGELDEAVRKAGRAAPSVDQIKIFRLHLQRALTDLGQIEVEERVLRVLERFTSTGGVPLLDITDDELDILRSNPSIADQFVVRRQV
ncbi:hypothetical protein [Agromyces ramosus]|uniref:hypothetical protein n=1 Tax=Agromyces ramosus TaxID=33879 RepID=UPI00102BBC51|nr:hypothetical protein [Agromyces ramosus]